MNRSLDIDTDKLIQTTLDRYQAGLVYITSHVQAAADNRQGRLCPATTVLESVVSVNPPGSCACEIAQA